MKRVFAALFTLAFSLPAWAQDSRPSSPDETESDLADFLDELRLDCEGEECREPEEDTADHTEADASEQVNAEDIDTETPADTAPEADVGAAVDEGERETATAPETEGPEGANEAEVTDTAAFDLSISPAAPLLDSSEYLTARGESTGEIIQLVWSIETFSADDEAVGSTRIRTLLMAPDFVRDEMGSEIHVYDFFASRHLEVNLDDGTYTNTAYEARLRRRLDTYLGLSRAGTLDVIPLGPDTGFERFWLEAAMGLRRDPAELESGLDDLTLTVSRSGDGEILSARFDTEPLASSEEDVDPQAGVDEQETDTAPADALRDAARPIDPGSEESVVFDPTQGRAGIDLSFDEDTSTLSYPASSPIEEAQAELFRRWMRHALPIHPDVLAQLRGAPSVPVEFSYFVVSPESPDGRREVWTLLSRDVREAGFRLEPDLVIQPAANEVLRDAILPAASSALDRQPPPEGVFQDIITDYRTQGDLARAYLTATQEAHHNGRCPPAGVTANRPVCQAYSSIVAAGLGNSSFEALFEAVSLAGSESSERVLAGLAPYLDEETLAGAAARILAADELIEWAIRDPEGPPEDSDPFRLLGQAIAIDPYATAAYQKFGAARLTLRDPIGAWAAFDAARAVPHNPDSPLIAQINELNARMRALAPDFFVAR